MNQKLKGWVFTCVSEELQHWSPFRGAFKYCKSSSYSLNLSIIIDALDLAY